MFDDAGDDLRHPRSAARRQRAHAELLGQHDAVAVRVVEHHAHGMPALEQLALDGGAPAALEKNVAQLVAVDPEIALEGGLVLDDLDVIGCHGVAAFVNLAGKLPKPQARRHLCVTRFLGECAGIKACAGAISRRPSQPRQI